jgi:LEA14-like dessication related protein
MIIRLLVTVSLVFTLLLIGCEIKPPDQLQFEGISWRKSNWKDKKLFIRCSLYNPNKRKLRIQHADVKIILEGIELGALAVIQKTNLEPLKRSTFDALLRINPSGLGQIAPIFALKKTYNLRIEGMYRVSGKPISVHQNLIIDPETEAYKGGLRILKQLIDKDTSN